MKFIQQHIEYQKAKLSFRIYGDGPQNLLCFHGFGQNCSYYSKFAAVASNAYTVYCFDLFYHGDSKWPSTKIPLEKGMWQKLLQIFLSTYGIDRFSIVGYSMGAKFVFTSIEKFAPRVEQVILLAPDGVKTSLFYNMATYPFGIRKYFKAMICNPQFYFNLVSFAGKLNLVDKGIIKFANSQMNTRRKRLQVYSSWIVFRKLRFDIKKIADCINQQQIPTQLILGKYDRIITEKNMGKLKKQLPGLKVTVLNTGHNDLIYQAALHFERNGIW